MELRDARSTGENVFAFRDLEGRYTIEHLTSNGSVEIVQPTSFRACLLSDYRSGHHDTRRAGFLHGSRTSRWEDASRILVQGYSKAITAPDQTAVLVGEADPGIALHFETNDGGAAYETIARGAGVDGNLSLNIVVDRVVWDMRGRTTQQRREQGGASETQVEEH